MKLASFNINTPAGGIKVIAIEIEKGMDIPDTEYNIEDEDFLEEIIEEIIEETIEEGVPDEVKNDFPDYRYIYQEYKSNMFICVFPPDLPPTLGDYVYDFIYSKRDLLKEYGRAPHKNPADIYKLNTLSQLLSIPRCKGCVYEANNQYYIQTNALLDDFLDKADKIPLNWNCILEDTENLYENT